jgi:hypothetical protein
LIIGAFGGMFLGGGVFFTSEGFVGGKLIGAVAILYLLI